MLYGTELVLDLGGCDTSKFNRKHIRLYCVQLCELLGMKPEDLYFWDDFRVPKSKKQTNPKTVGTSAIQFILTSNITIHTLDMLRTVLVNIFSCEEYNTSKAKNFTKSFFAANRCRATTVRRFSL